MNKKALSLSFPFIILLLIGVLVVAMAASPAAKLFGSISGLVGGMTAKQDEALSAIEQLNLYFTDNPGIKDCNDPEVVCNEQEQQNWESYQRYTEVSQTQQHQTFSSSLLQSQICSDGTTCLTKDALGSYTAVIVSCWHRDNPQNFNFKTHGATDYVLILDENTKVDIPSLTAGKVKEIGTAGGYGNYITIESNGWFFQYGHLQSVNRGLSEGDDVLAGTILGKQGGSCGDERSACTNFKDHVDFRISKESAARKNIEQQAPSATYVVSTLQALGIGTINVRAQCFDDPKNPDEAFQSRLQP